MWEGQSSGKWESVPAVSGGGRGQRVKKQELPYGAGGARERTGRIANMGGDLPDMQPFIHRTGKPKATQFGVIPNGVFEVGPVHCDSNLKMCARLAPVEGAMMGRKGFHIHGQGPTGSEGCIVPLHGRLGHVLEHITKLRQRGPLFLRVEGSVTLDLPDTLPARA